MRINYSLEQFGRALTESENRAVQLEILKYVAQFCERHGLRYFLADGTLIGAVRHKGYIPWDDDIDIRMPRPDLMQLIETFNEESGNSKYALIAPTMETAQHYVVKIINTETVKIEPYLDYSKAFLGVDIDVFPLDGCPEDEKEYSQWNKKIRLLNKAYNYKKKGIWRSMLSRGKDFLCNRNRAMFCPFMSCEQIAEKVKDLSLQYPYESSKYICAVGIGDRFRVPRECYDDYIMAPFEGSSFRIPAGYDMVLKAEYGDYMTLPPERERVTHHTNSVYWKNKDA